MSDECFRVEELNSLLDLDPEDPRARHLEGCPLCRARLAAYRAFIADGPPLSGSDPARAEAELDAFMTKMIHGSVGVETRSRFLSLLRGRGVSKRAAVAGFAAAAVAAAILIIALRPIPDGELDHTAPLRGLETPGARVAAPAVHPAAVANETITFTWARVPGSDGYAVQLFDTRLDEIARFEAGRDTSLAVGVAEMPETDGALFWRVTAFREGDEIAHSRLLSLELDTH